MTVGFITRHPETLRVLNDARRIAEGDAPVLIVGETGTGKVVVARHIRECSPRREGPFVQTDGMDVRAFETQLFGGFGSTAKAAEADGGSLVIDFGRPLPAAFQTRLVELIHSGVYYDGTSDGERSADVRVMALTKLDLEDEAREGRLDARLLYVLRRKYGAYRPVARPARRYPTPNRALPYSAHAPRPHNARFRARGAGDAHAACVAGERARSDGGR